MLELISLLLPTLARLFRNRHDLVVENLLLRHQLQVALRSRPRPDLKIRDRFFWLLVRSLYPDWKRHLILVRPETVLRWHRQGWQLRCPTGPRRPPPCLSESSLNRTDFLPPYNLSSLTTFLHFPVEHRERIRHTNLLERTFGESRRRTKVIGRRPGEQSCLTLLWAVPDRASHGWRRLEMTPASVRRRQDLRRQLLPPLELAAVE